jgi:hypothetical protein
MRDAGRASWAFTAASKEILQGIARISGRETASMVSINSDSHESRPSPDRQGRDPAGSCWPIACPYPIR